VDEADADEAIEDAEELEDADETLSDEIEVESDREKRPELGGRDAVPPGPSLQGAWPLGPMSFQRRTGWGLSSHPVRR
jgi:hypothetical protein